MASPRYGVKLSLDACVKVGAIVVGSVAVSRNGARIGKGEGFAELEYGILRWMGAIDDSTPVITTVRDEQVVEIEAGKMLEHDVPVDIIVTPTQVHVGELCCDVQPGLLRALGLPWEPC